MKKACNVIAFWAGDRANISYGDIVKEYNPLELIDFLYHTHATVDGGMDACWDATNNKVLVAYKNTYGSGGYPHAFAISCSGTTLTQGGRYQIMNIEISAFIRCAFDSDQGKAMVNYTMASNNKLVRCVIILTNIKRFVNIF